MRYVLPLVLFVFILVTGCTQSSAPIATPTATATAIPLPTPSAPTSTMSNSALSPEVKTAVLVAIAKQQNVAVDQLKITIVTEADWPDACLGLAKSDEMCAQMITPGWAITVTDGAQTWNYRIDLDGQQARLDQAK